MKIIVAGAHGSIGQRLVRLALLSPDHHIVLGLDSAPHPLPSIYRHLIPPDTPDDVDVDLEKEKKDGRYVFERVDLREYEEIERVLRVWLGMSNKVGEGDLDSDKRGKGEDEVGLANLAGISHTGDGVARTHNMNVIISWSLLRVCAELGITRIAQASSINVLRGIFGKMHDFQYFPIDENHPCEPDEPYGLSKIIMEMQSDTLTRRYPYLRIASLRLHRSVPIRLIARRAFGVPDLKENDQEAGGVRIDEATAAKDLWGWVQEDEGARAFLLAMTLPLSVRATGGSGEEAASTLKGTRWTGHEAFYIVAPDLHVADTDLPEGENVDGMSLKEKWWQGARVREGWWDGTGDMVEGESARSVAPRRRAFYDCSKAERMLGWVHKVY